MESGAMDAFCNSTFWDANETWYTENPEISPCFQNTVLVWIPCLFLWIFSPLETYYILHSKTRNIPWNWLNITKLALTGVLVVLSVVDAGHAVHRSANGYVVSSADFYSPLIKIATFSFSAVLIVYNRVRGMRTSGLLFLFWLLLAICGAVRYRYELTTADASENDGLFQFVSYMAYYPLVLAMLLLNCFADAPPQFSEYPSVERPCPEQSASFLSKLFFAWFDKLAWKGFRNPLETKDLWSMNPEDTATEVVPQFDKHWEKTLRKHSNVPSPQATFRKSSGNVDITSPKQQKKRQASILPALCKAFGPTFIFGSLLKLVQDIMTFASPQILALLISFVEGKEELWKGYFYAILMLVTACIQTLVLSQYFNRMFLVGLRIRTAVISAIYRKAMRMSNSARKESTVGEIVNLMSVDAQRFMDLTAYLNMIWSAPLQITLALIFLYQTLGASVFAGLAVMIILIPVNGVVANRIKTLQIRQMKSKDERVKLMNEVLSGIKVLKLYAWEPSFEQQILKIRDKEIAVLKQAAYLNAGTSFIWSCAPFLVSLVTLATYVLVDPTHVLDSKKAFVSLALFNIIRFPISLLPFLIILVIQVSLVSFATFVLSSDDNILTSKKAFVSLSLFNILRFPLSMLPMLISNMVQASVSIKRMNKFMNSEELNPNNVQHDPAERDPLVIENGTFAWGSDEPPVLKNINLSFKQGSLVAVVGTVGSGKSSLLSAFLGEMDKLTGRVNTKGSIAYVPQQAWIQNATLRDNIIFGESHDPTSYQRVIEACALKPDLEMLPGGDQTEIGEKGINLSGGQKQRVSLARAVYNNADVYFLDDPLSAVDSHVGKHIFENVIGPSGMLHKKTRVLVTHGITYLPDVDLIVVLNEGEVSELGTYNQLLEKKGAFAEFLVQHLQEVSGDDGTSEADLDEIKQQLESTMGVEELQQRLIRARSRVSESQSDTGSVSGDKRSLSDSLNRQQSVESNTEKSGSRRRLNSLDSKETGNNINNVAKPLGDKLIEAEKAETGSVKWHVYAHYLKSIGLFLSAATILFNLIFQAFSIGSNVWLSMWSNDDQIYVNGTQNEGRRDMYLGVYGALGAGQVITVLLASLSNFIGTLSAAHILHALSLANILRAPLSFFDVTPVGRVLNRFSKDVDVMDNVLPMTIRGWLSCLFSRRYSMWASPPSSAFASFYCDLAPQLGCWTAAKIMHIIMLRGIMRAPLTFFDTTPLGRIIGRFAKDVDVLDTGLPQQVSDSLYCLFEVNCREKEMQEYKFYRVCLNSGIDKKAKNIQQRSYSLFIFAFHRVMVTVIATLVVISYSTPIFMSVIFPIGVLYYFIQRFYVATSRQLKRLESVSRSPIYSHFGESITGAPTIRAYNVEQRFVRESENRVDFNQVCYYPSIIANRWLAVRLEMVGNLIIFFSSLFAVLGRDTLSPGLVGLSVSYALQITQTLNWLVRMTSDVETNIVAVERIKEYGETKQEAPWEIPSTQPPTNWPDKGEVVFKDYQVRYREGLELVLKGISFTVYGGEKVGIVGRTGAGKSSLTLGLFRIIEPAGGQILIDGVDISKIGLHALRSRLTIIPQDPVLFSGTLRINLDPFGTHSDSDVWRALEHAHLKAFVKGLPAALEHQVSEGGENLSVGQRQLICLARALLRKTKVLILDEATAAVDLETDDLIQRTIRSEFKDCTVLTIAHRLNTIMDSNRVIVLDKGLLVEYDSPEVLLQNRQSIFYGMAKDAGLV